MKYRNSNYWGDMDNTQLKREAKLKAARSQSRASIIMVILLVAMVALVAWVERDADQPSYSGKVM